MTRALLLAFLVVLLGVVSTPLDGEVRGRRDVHGPATSAADAAYRLRLVELTLATGSAPRRDAFVSAGDELVPWPPLVHALLARALRADLGAEATAVSEGDVDDALLEERVDFYGKLLASLTALVVALGARRLARGVATATTRDVGLAGLAAVVLFAFVPTTDVSVGGSALFAAPWIQLSVAAQLLFAVVAGQAREHFGRLLPAALAGAAAGLGFVADFAVLPVALAVGGLFVRDAWVRTSAATRGGGDAGDPTGLDPWHPTMLWAMFALTPIAFTPGPLPWALAWPRLAAPAVASCAAAWALLAGLGLRQRAHTERGPWERPVGGAALAVALLVAIPVAGADARYRPALAPLIALAYGFVFAGRARTAFAAGGSRRARLELALLLLLPALGWLGVRGSERLQAAQPRDVADFARVASRIPSLGAWNHPGAEPRSRVLVPPRAAAELSLRARRPVVALQLPGFPESDAARAVRELLAASDREGFEARAVALGAAYWLPLGSEVGAGLAALDDERPPIFVLSSSRKPAQLTAPVADE